jgi:hypothetical protein
VLFTICSVHGVGEASKWNVPPPVPPGLEGKVTPIVGGCTIGKFGGVMENGGGGAKLGGIAGTGSDSGKTGGVGGGRYPEIPLLGGTLEIPAA